MSGEVFSVSEAAACRVTPSCHDSNQDSSLPIHRWCLLSVGNDVFAVDLQQVCEVVRVEAIVPIPGVPPALVGMMTWKGLVIPLVDISVLLDGLQTSKCRYAALVRQEGTTVGILLDEIPKILTGSFGAIQQDTIDGVGGGESIFCAVIAGSAQQYRLLDVSAFFRVLQSLSASHRLSGVRRS